MFRDSFEIEFFSKLMRADLFTLNLLFVPNSTSVWRVQERESEELRESEREGERKRK